MDNGKTRLNEPIKYDYCVVMAVGLVLFYYRQNCVLNVKEI